MLFQIAALLLPVAAASGWWLGKKDVVSSEFKKNKKLHNDYFRGLNYVINDQADKAVDVFIHLLEVDGDTVETHLALGHLFRSRGELDRATRIHQNLIARPKLNFEHKVQALMALGQDYLSAGVLDRAERIFLELIQLGQKDVMIFNALIRIYENECDWAKAIQIARRIESINKKSKKIDIAQFYCELALQMFEENQSKQAQSYLQQALVVNEKCVRATIILARFKSQGFHFDEAIDLYRQARRQAPELVTYFLSDMMTCLTTMGERERGLEILMQWLEQDPEIIYALSNHEFHEYIVTRASAGRVITEHLAEHYSLRGLDYFFSTYLQDCADDTVKLQAVYRYLHELIQQNISYQCHRCGFSSSSLLWSCPSCHCWSTMKPKLFTPYKR